MGNLGSLKKRTRDTWGFAWLEALLQDVRYGLRVLAKNPGFTVAAVRVRVFPERTARPVLAVAGSLVVLVAAGLFTRSLTRAESIDLGFEPLPASERVPGAGLNCISPDYFTTLRMHMLKGRVFTDADTATSQPVAIVNQTMAARRATKVDPMVALRCE